MPGFDDDTRIADLDEILSSAQQALVEQPDKKRKKRRLPRWLAIVLAAATIDLGARFFVPSSMPFVLKFEAFLFLGTAAILAIPIFKKANLSRIRRRIHGWLSGAFVLGGIRSGMWGFGIPVQYANLTIFLLGVGALAVVLLLRRRARRKKVIISDG